ncbi:MAG TPA: hypothetical protein VNS12_05975 [Pelagibacterium sp.]|uniref:hypothetical protein n=1 Tax=Pelagibacterium sp. TaxID=1967288 RepID=UPI002C2F8D3E|nr:hypothetical protein [Pelagibacterium sp.]HWJ87598.1 hypothetical protein [Pelagibacterium sp.]
MIAAWAMIVGGILRGAGEVLEILAGHHTGPSGACAGLALVFVAIGFAGLWPEARISRAGRAAVVLVGAGALAFTAVAIWSIGQGVLPLADIVRTPGFMVAAAIALAGALALAAWLIATPAYPRWIGIVMSVSIGLSLVSSFVAFPAPVQPLIDMVMALTFIQLGLSMRERRKFGTSLP